jgi:hypothetical protein
MRCPHIILIPNFKYKIKIIGFWGGAAIGLKLLF